MTKPLALIIEDDWKLADIFSLALRSAEFETEVVHDGAQARTRLAAVVPAIVVLDMHLPRVSGKEILSQIQADERFAQTRVIITTADALIAEDLRDDTDLVLLKPVSVTQLRDMASRLRPSALR
jgi:DNA-binding response OmpR family regulator